MQTLPPDGCDQVVVCLLVSWLLNVSKTVKSVSQGQIYCTRKALPPTDNSEVVKNFHEKITPEHSSHIFELWNHFRVNNFNSGIIMYGVCFLGVTLPLPIQHDTGNGQSLMWTKA